MSVESIILIAVAAVLISASVSDVRTREISDVHWMVIGTMGIVMALFSENILGGILCAGGYLMFMLFMFSERVQGRISAIVVTLGLLLLIASSLVSSSPYPIVTAVMTMLFLGMFMLGTMKGGADVKALRVPGISGDIVCPVGSGLSDEFGVQPRVLRVLHSRDPLHGVCGDDEPPQVRRDEDIIIRHHKGGCRIVLRVDFGRNR